MSDLRHVQDGNFLINHLHIPYTVGQSLDNVFNIEIGAEDHSGQVFASVEIILRQDGNIEVLGRNKGGIYHTFELGSLIAGVCK